MDVKKAKQLERKRKSLWQEVKNHPQTQIMIISSIVSTAIILAAIWIVFLKNGRLF